MKLKPTKSSTSLRARASFATAWLMTVFALAATVQIGNIHARQASDAAPPAQDQPSGAEPSGTGGTSATPLELIKEHLEAAQTHVFSAEAAADLPLLAGVYEPTVAVDPHKSSARGRRLWFPTPCINQWWSELSAGGLCDGSR